MEGLRQSVQNFFNGCRTITDRLPSANGKVSKKVECLTFRDVIKEVGKDELEFRKFVRHIAGTPEQFNLWWSMGTGVFLSELATYVETKIREKPNGRPVNT